MNWGHLLRRHDFIIPDLVSHHKYRSVVDWLKINHKEQQINFSYFYDKNGYRRTVLDIDVFLNGTRVKLNYRSLTPAEDKNFVDEFQNVLIQMYLQNPELKKQFCNNLEGIRLELSDELKDFYETIEGRLLGDYVIK